MNQINVPKLVKKAVGLAEICSCDVEDAIKYLAARETLKDVDVTTESMITGLPVEMIKCFDGAMLYHVFLS